MGTNNKTANTGKVTNQNYVAPAIPNWQQAGLQKFSQLVIGNGPHSTTANIINPTKASGQRKTLLVNNAMAGQTVAQYFRASKQAFGGTGAGNNNAVLAHKLGLITLQLPK